MKKAQKPSSKESPRVAIPVPAHRWMLTLMLSLQVRRAVASAPHRTSLSVGCMQKLPLRALLCRRRRHAQHSATHQRWPSLKVHRGTHEFLRLIRGRRGSDCRGQIQDHRATWWWAALSAMFWFGLSHTWLYAVIPTSPCAAQSVHKCRAQHCDRNTGTFNEYDKQHWVKAKSKIDGNPTVGSSAT